MPEQTPKRVADALRAVVKAHKAVIAAVTPGHPDAILGKGDEYSAVFSRWHRACDEAAVVLDWPHRDEVAREAGKEGSMIR